MEQQGSLTAPAETLLFGDETIADSGNGVLLRVASDPAAQLVRSGVSSATVPSLVVGARALITGQSVTLDSTSATSLDPSANVSGNAVALNSGQISLVLSNPGQLNPTTGLVLSGSALENLEATAQALSLLSYSSFDIYGIGQVGNLAITGRPAAASLALHAAEIRGFNNSGGIVSFVARDVLLDNSPNGVAVGSAAPSMGTLQFVGDTIRLGENQVDVDQFANLTLAASGGILLQDLGGLTVAGNVTLLTPSVTGAAGSNQSILAAGDLTLSNSASPTTAGLESGLGASLTLQGSTVTVESNLVLPSGAVTLHATTGNLLVNGTIDVSGTAQSFFDLTQYTNGGQVSLSADLGYVLLPPGSTINVSAQPEGGDAGTLTISAPTRFVFPGGTLLGQAGTGGQAGTFSLDSGLLASLGSLNAYLDAGSFTQARSIRVRTGDVVLDGEAKVNSFNLSADAGSITVTGTVDASGTTGGEIDLERPAMSSYLPVRCSPLPANSWTLRGKAAPCHSKRLAAQ